MVITLWAWFVLGAWANILKRAYLKVKGPDQSTTTYAAYFEQYWPILLFRGVCGGALFWLTFEPDTLANILRLVGWSSLGTIPAVFPHNGVVALMIGLGVDSVLDFISMKIPFLAGFIPQFTIAVSQQQINQAAEKKP